jgi:hypothetical protein
MADNNSSLLRSSKQTPSFRLWAVLTLVALIGVVIFVPVRIGSMGFMPPDDAGRHIGKAISGKSWNKILVMRPEITTDMHHGWDVLLAALYNHAGLSADALMAFSMSFCFMLFAALPLFFLKRPEAWIAALGLLLIFDPFMLSRFFLGRPFIISSAMLALLLLTWERFARKRTDFTYLILFIGAMTLTSWLAPTAAYLFIIPLIGFAFARQWQALIRISTGIIIGCAVGFALTGYPVRLAKNVFYMLTMAPDQNLLSRMLVTEFMPQGGNFLVALVIVALIAIRIYRKQWNRVVIDNPVFWNILAGLFLGFFVGRFWSDWGLIAAFVWIARELSLLSEEFLLFNSIKRFITIGVVAICFFIVITSDIQSRWSFCVPRYPLQYDLATKEEKTWFPDSGGVLYNDNMLLFYQTFFYNPHAPWRYMVGFEPVLMKPEDLTIYRNIQRSNNAVDSYEPWIKKMTVKDRMAFCTDKKPDINSLEWKSINRNTWLGRLPRKEIVDTGTVKNRAGT